MDWLTDTTKPVIAEFSPIVAALLVFLLGFGGVMMTRRIYEGEFYLTRWWSFRIGDSIALPLFAFFTALAFQKSTEWWNPRWFNYTLFLALVILGVVFARQLLLDAMINRSVSFAEANRPSERFHTYITWPSIFALVGTALIPLWTCDAPMRYKVLATTGLILYSLTFLVDNTLVNRSTEGI